MSQISPGGASLADMLVRVNSYVETGANPELPGMALVSGNLRMFVRSAPPDLAIVPPGLRRLTTWLDRWPLESFDIPFWRSLQPERRAEYLLSSQWTPLWAHDIEEVAL